MRILHCLLIVIFAFISCNSGKAQKGQNAESAQNSPQKFTLPEIPLMYTAPEQRADFLVKHYWDNFDFADTAYIHLPEITEQAYVDFLDIANHSTMEAVCEGIKQLMTKAEKDKKVYDYFVSLADKYLYDPNSPFRNEELYIAVLEKMTETNLLDDVEKTRPRYRLNLAHKNRLGTKALNFTYTTPSGKQGTLYGLATEYVLLYINNPGCHACNEIAEGMRESEELQHLLSGKRLSLLCIYPDEDMDEWKKHRNDFPANWINSYDKGTAIRNNDLYDLKAIPSLYLLDKNKTVLLKDATWPQVQQYLAYILNPPRFD